VLPRWPKLTEFSELSQCNEQDELARGSHQLARLVEAAATWKIRNPEDASLVDEIMDFVSSHLHELEARIGSDKPNPGIDEMIELSNEAWSEYLSLSESLPVPDGSWDEDFAADFEDSELETEKTDEALPSGSDIEMLLGALSGISITSSGDSGIAAVEAIEIEAEVVSKPTEGGVSKAKKTPTKQTKRVSLLPGNASAKKALFEDKPSAAEKSSTSDKPSATSENKTAPKSKQEAKSKREKQEPRGN